MELQVNENVRIVTDAYNFIVQEASVVKEDCPVRKDGTQRMKGDIIWTDSSYHGNLPDACKSMVEKGVKYQDTFAEVMSFLSLVYDKIDKLKK
jgi:hypothetical protein